MNIKSKEATKTGKIQEKIPACKDAKTKKRSIKTQVSDSSDKKNEMVKYTKWICKRRPKLSSTHKSWPCCSGGQDE